MNALVVSCPSISIAQTHPIYNVGDVERKLDKLPPKEHEALRAIYERMIEKGPHRFQVKPSGIPAMQHLYDELPNFHDVLDHVRRSVALIQDSPDPLEIPPMLILGPPGVGKTHFAREVAKLLGTGTGFVSMSSMTAGWILSGASSQWKGARPGKVFESLVDGMYANPVMIVDEIDKARGEHAYDPLGSLYSLLEHDTARDFTDEFAEIPIDTSQVIWVATANDERVIPEPILNRMNVFEARELTQDQARIVGLKLYKEIRSAHEWGNRFDEAPSDEVMDTISGMAPREMRRAWMIAFGNAKLAGRYTVESADFGVIKSGKKSIGFVQ